MTIYHRDKGIPKEVLADVEQHRMQRLRFALYGSGHYLKQIRERGLPEPVPLDWLREGAIIEVVMTDDLEVSLTSYLVRGHWKGDRDLSVVVSATMDCIITGWFNHKDDQHRLTNERSQQYEQVP